MRKNYMYDTYTAGVGADICSWRVWFFLPIFGHAGQPLSQQQQQQQLLFSLFLPLYAWERSKATHMYVDREYKYIYLIATRWPAPVNTSHALDKMAESALGTDSPYVHNIFYVLFSLHLKKKNFLFKLKFKNIYVIDEM